VLTGDFPLLLLCWLFLLPFGFFRHYYSLKLYSVDFLFKFVPITKPSAPFTPSHCVRASSSLQIHALRVFVFVYALYIGEWMLEQVALRQCDCEVVIE